MANGDDFDPSRDLPTPPRAPKLDVAAPITPPSTRKYVAYPGNSEAYSADDLSSETRGPLTSKPDVEKQLSARWKLQQQRDLAREQQRNREYARPTQLRGSRALGGKR